MTSRSERELGPWGPNDNRRADAANEEVNRITLADRLEGKALSNRFRRVAGNVRVPRFGAWCSPA
jgi:hypothetical protein